MTSFVFVLMVYAHGGYYVPTLEFNDSVSCEKAVKNYNSMHSSWVFNPKSAFCRKFEK